MQFTLTILTLCIILIFTWRFLGSYITAVYTNKINYLRAAERLIFKALNIDQFGEQSWQRYTLSLVVFSIVSIFITYALLRLQGGLFLNPQHLAGVTPALSFNTAVSFVTNTNWQNYAGETTMSYLSQMVSLSVQQFVSPAVGMCVAVVLIRGIARRESKTVGNFWVDLVRGVLYIFLPLAIVSGIIFVSQGAVQTLAGPILIKNSLTHFSQTIPRGPVAFMEAIKELGTNGGGFFNANGSHPFENPTGTTNLLSIVLMLSIPVALTYTFGKMVGNIKQGFILLLTMAILFAGCLGLALYGESHGSIAISSSHVSQTISGNMEGKEVRFGTSNSALYNIASTQTSTGSVNSANDSYTPLGTTALISGMMLGEVSPGGVGSGLYTILLFAIIAVFIAGLMVGRTPELLGKKIQAKEVKLAGLAILIMPITVLVFTGIAVAIHAGQSGAFNRGPQGFTEILYAYTSQANNNGSALAGLNGNTDFYNITGAIAMMLGRFAVILPTTALAGSLALKKTVPNSLGTFKTDNLLFGGLLTGTIVLVGGLTFFPALALGPIVQSLSHKVF